MEVTRELVTELENQSMLELSESERESFTRDLQGILAYIDLAFAEVDTQEVEPLVYVLPTENVKREDAVQPSPEPSVLLSNAVNRKGTYFKVPKTID